MKDKTLRRLPLYVIILLFLCLIGLVGITSHAIHSGNSQKVILYLKMQDDNHEKPPYYRKLRANGVKDKTKKFRIRNEEIVNATYSFTSHIDKKSNSIYLTLKHKPLHNQYHKKVNDPIYTRMVKQIAKNQKHDIFNFTIFKVQHKYYAYLELNAGLDDTGTIYRYSFKKKKMIVIGGTENDQAVIAIKNPK